MARFQNVLASAVAVLVLASLVAAVTSPMPYRPGYGLGSWIPPEVIEGMKVEAYARSAIKLADQMVNDATSLARELQIAQYPVKNPLSNQQEIKVPLSDQDFKKYMDRINGIRTKSWGAKIEQYDNLFNQMDAQMTELTAASKGSGQGTVKAFSTFASAVESPVLWDSSTVEYVDRAFDSLSVSSSYMDIEAIKQMTSESRSEDSESAKVGLNFPEYLAMSTEVKNSAMQQLTKTYSIKSVETTLVLSSFATHRMVKQFTALNVDPDKLREAWNYWKPHDPIPHPVYQKAAFLALAQRVGATTDPKIIEDKISFVSEVFQGSALVGFVHFIKVEKTDSSASQNEAKRSGMVELELTKYLDTITGSTEFSRESAEKIANMASDSGLDIQFDLVCMGYVPNIKSQVIETAIASFKNIDVNSQSSNRQGAAAQTEKQDNTNSVIGGTLGALNKMVSENPVLGVQTFMDAFDDYAQAAHSRPDEIGAPVGLNVKQYSKIDVMSILADHYLGPKGEKTDQSSGSSNNSQSGDASTPDATQ